VTIWSNWTRILPKDGLNSDDMITETRTRFVCTMPLLVDQQALAIKSDKIIYRMCDNKGNDCQEQGNFTIMDRRYL